MAFHFHKDKQLYFEYQKTNATDFVIPFIEEKFTLKANAQVLEIGCAEGGVLKSFVDKGCIGTGVELMETRYELAKQFMADDIKANRVKMIRKNIYDVDFQEEVDTQFDLIILKDVIEHIHDQKKLFVAMKKLLKPDGHIFFGFPPWQMPFGGHQQICKGKWLGKLPYYHLLPETLYKTILRTFGESDQTIEDLLEIKETGISLERFEKITAETDYEIVNKKLFLVNPIYKYKFKLKPRTQFPLLANLPYLRNFVTTCGYYLIRMKGSVALEAQKQSNTTASV